MNGFLGAYSACAYSAVPGRLMARCIRLFSRRLTAAVPYRRNLDVDAAARVGTGF